MHASRLGTAFTAVLALGSLACTPASSQSPPTSSTTERFAGRDVLVFVPPQVPAPGKRALVVVLHGALGNAAGIEGATAEAGLRMDAQAATSGFVVAYLNGTPVSARRGPERKGWNAGACCGLPATLGIDDTDYIAKTTAHLVDEHGIDPSRVFVLGHSNGAMMALRLMCQTTAFSAAVSVSGPLEIDAKDCTLARGRRILSIHGALDANVPVAGGRGPVGLSGIAFRSERDTQAIFAAAGADFHLEIVPGAVHQLADIDAKLRATDGTSLAEKAARFFGLTP